MQSPHRFSLFLIFVFAAAFGAPSSGAEADGGKRRDDPPESQATDQFRILFLGNSHSALNNLPGLVSRLIELGVPAAEVVTELAPGYRFLDERLNDGVSLRLLDSAPWTHVVLQAQKYSTSGTVWYSTAPAEQWIRRVRARNAQPILFPEWPRRGNREEGDRVHRLHLGIAEREPACVAPIGLAWEESLERKPALELHARDGNHSNRAGALLTAYVLYQVITGQAAVDLPQLEPLDVDAVTQRHLRAIATRVTHREQFGCPAALSNDLIRWPWIGRPLVHRYSRNPTATPQPSPAPRDATMGHIAVH